MPPSALPPKADMSRKTWCGKGAFATFPPLVVRFLMLRTPSLATEARPRGPAPLPTLRLRGCDKLTRRAKFRLTRRANHFYKFARLTRQQGRIAIVTNAGWDAVDAAASGVTRDGRAGWRKARERSAACRRPMLKRTAKPCGPGIRC